MPIILDGTNGISQDTGVAVIPAGSASAPSLSPSGDSNTGVYFPGADRVGFAVGGSQAGEFDASGNLKFNSGYGSVGTAYGCRAWVNFNGTGTVAIRASGNVSSITDHSTGDYTINLTTAMPDANYCVQGTAEGQNGMGSGAWGIYFSQQYSAVPTTTTVRVSTLQDNNSYADSRYVHVAIFR